MWIYIWEVLNLLAIVGLVVALGKIFYRGNKGKVIFTGWYSWLGFWAMLHDPVHFVVFLILLLIIPVEVYLVFLIFVLSKYLKEAYIDVSFTNFYIALNYQRKLMFYFFSQFLEKEQRRGTLDSQPEAEGSLFKHNQYEKKRQNNTKQ